MTDVQTDAGRVGEHVEDVALGPAGPARGAERSVLVPVALPAGLDLEVVVGHVLLYPVAAVPPSVCVRQAREEVLGGHAGPEQTLPALRPLARVSWCSLASTVKEDEVGPVPNNEDDAELTTVMEP